MSRTGSERRAILAEAEEMSRQPRRERCREVAHDLELTTVNELVDEITHGCIDGAFETLHRLRREPARHELTLRAVCRIVLRDHVLFLRSNARSVTTAARENVGAALDLDQRRVLYHRPQLVLLVAPHGTLRPHAAERVVHAFEVRAEVRVEQIRRHAAILHYSTAKSAVMTPMNSG